MKFGILVGAQNVSYAYRTWFWALGEDLLWLFDTQEEAESQCVKLRADTIYSGVNTFTPKRISKKFCRQWAKTKNQGFIE